MVEDLDGSPSPFRTCAAASHGGPIRGSKGVEAVSFVLTTHRNPSLETRLQTALDDGRKVWAVGDVHGQADALRRLLLDMDLQPGDEVVLLGDLIDRGPDSHGVLVMARDLDHVHAIQGNHEGMMLATYTSSDASNRWHWTGNGGDAALSSMPGGTSSERDRAASRWVPFLQGLPTEIVLDRHRMVHAGYDWRRPLDQQTDEDRTWSRTIVHAKEPVDPQRQVLVGHTPTQMLDGYGLSDPKGAYRSRVLLPDGRPSLIMLDTGAAYGRRLKGSSLTAMELGSGTVRSVPVG